MFFALTLISFVVVYRKKQKEYGYRQERLQQEFKEELLTAQLEAQEQTLRTLSQELHDNIGQVLSLVKLNVSMIDLSGAGLQAEAGLKEVKALINTAIGDLRNISKTLNSEYVKENDLEGSIQRELGSLSKTKRFETSLNMETPGPIDIDPERRLIVFRIVQEALNNIVKHAAASSIHVRMAMESQSLSIAIRDNGKGFDVRHTPKGLGLLNLQHRAMLIGSRLEIDSAPGKGTLVTLWVPGAGPEETIDTNDQSSISGRP